MKTTAILFMFLIISSALIAQVSIAPVIGASYSSRSGWYNDNWGGPKLNNKFIFGFTGGISLNIKVSEKMSLQPEFLYIQKGMKTANFYPFFFGYDNNFKSGSYKITYNFIELPLLIKFTFGNKFKYFITAGPYFAYAIDGRYVYHPQGNLSEKVSSGRIIFKPFEEENFEEGRPHDPDYCNRMDAGVYIGAGIGKEIGFGTLILDLRFGMGFIDYYKTENFDIVPEGYRPFYNRNINLTLAYYFPIGKQRTQ
jgi:hypothetical protein